MSNHDRIVERYEGLEATAANLKRLLGEAGAKALAEAFGGRRLYIPRQPGPHHPITAVVGQEGADRLAGAFHGVAVDVPMLPARKAEIMRLDSAGETRAAIARQLRVTERWVYKVLSEAPSSAPEQPGLFD